MLFQNNTLTYVDNGANLGTKMVMNLRDYARFNKFISNDIEVSGSAVNCILASNDGTYGLGHTFCDDSPTDGQPAYNVWNGNTIRIVNPGSATVAGPAFDWEDGARGDVVMFNSFITDGSQPVVHIARCDSVTFSHNRCWTTGGQVANLGYDTSDGSTSHISADTFYGTGSNSDVSPNLLVGTHCVVDSLGLVFNIGASADSEVAVELLGDAAVHPDSLGLKGSAAWYTPEIADSNYTAADPSLLQGGHSISTKMTNGYAGPTRATNPPDALASIEGVTRNVSISPATATVEFYVPIAIASYEARLIPSSLDPYDDYDSGTAVTLPSPASSGSLQSVTVNVPTDQDYWLSVKTVSPYSHKSSITTIGIKHTNPSPWFFPD